MRPLTLISLVPALLLATEPAVGAPVYTYVSDKTAYSAAPGQTVVVDIFLDEKLSAGDQSLIDSDGGLAGAGFAVALAPSQTNAGSLAAISGDSTSFDGGFYPGPANSGTYMSGDNQQNLFDSSGPKPSTMGLLSIGSVTVKASTVANTATTYDLGAYMPGSGGYTQVFQSPYDDLDLTNNGGSGSDIYTGAGGTAANPLLYNNTFTVTAVVPEPASFASLLLGLPLLARRNRQGQ